MARSTTDSCCLTLPLLTEKWQEDRLEKRFEIARQIYNSLLRYELKKYRRFQNLPSVLPLNERLKQVGLSEYVFKSDVKLFYKHFKDNIGSSVAVHGIAAQVWTAFDKVLFGNGRILHFKRKGEMFSVRGAANTGKDKNGNSKSGGLEIRFVDGVVIWNGLKIRVKLDPHNDYENQMLLHRIKYCRILKRTGKHKDRYYVQLTLECKPVVKADPHTGDIRHPVGNGPVGLDLGPQTLAFSAPGECGLVLLASRVHSIEREKMKLQRKMDRSRRASNPDNYAPDGTIIRGRKLTHNKSHRYLLMQRRLAYLQSHQATLRKLAHNQLANQLLSLGDHFIIENNPVSGWARRSKETHISEKTGRYKRKKRFGKSIGNRAPSMLITILDQKLQSRGLSKVIRVPTTMKASQFNHMTHDFAPKPLSQRWNAMPDGRYIQRDLYSAFLLQHVIDPNGTQEYIYNVDAIHRDYPSFCLRHDLAIAFLRETGEFTTSMGLHREPAAVMESL